MGFSGSYGCVYLAKYLPDNTLVAVKLFLKEEQDDDEILQEAGINKCLSDVRVCPTFYGLALMAAGSDCRFSRLAMVSRFIGEEHPDTAKPYQGTTLADFIKHKSPREKKSKGFRWARKGSAASNASAEVYMGDLAEMKDSGIDLDFISTTSTVK